jgi:subtilisin family serine protease
VGVLATLVSALLPAGAAADQERFVPGELLVRFERGADASERSAALSAVEATTRERLFVPGLRLVELGGASVPGAAAALARQPGVRYAEPNHLDRVFAIPNDPQFGLQWALHNTGQDVAPSLPGGIGTTDADIDAPSGWDLGRGSQKVILGIADNGVQYTHPDLAPNMYTNPGETAGNNETDGVDDDGNGKVDDWHGWDFLDEDNNPAPSGVAGSQHGTQVAGVAGAQGGNGVGISGVSQEVALLPLRIGNTTTLSIADSIEAFGYARARGAKVVNLSAGSSAFSQARLDAIRAASNTLFVFAAGNGGADGVGDNNDAFPIYPCNHNEANVVCVASTGQTDQRAPSSNFGASTVDLAAPGTLIQTTTLAGGYGLASGTSMAAPVVAGAAAVYRALHPAASAAATRAALRAGVDKLTSLNNRVEADGRLNLASTLPYPPPETTITKAPKAKVKTRKRKKKAKFEFASSEAPPSFQCSVDGEDFEECASPFEVKVGRGKHELLVRAIDATRNADPTPAVHQWKVKRKRKRR